MWPSLWDTGMALQRPPALLCWTALHTVNSQVLHPDAAVVLIILQGPAPQITQHSQSWSVFAIAKVSSTVKPLGYLALCCSPEHDGITDSILFSLAHPHPHRSLYSRDQRSSNC